jgi:hypothetical protein
MTRIRLVIEEASLPADAEPMARIELSTGTCLDLTLSEWRELIARLEISAKT